MRTNQSVITSPSVALTRRLARLPYCQVNAEFSGTHVATGFDIEIGSSARAQGPSSNAFQVAPKRIPGNGKSVAWKGILIILLTVVVVSIINRKVVVIIYIVSFLVVFFSPMLFSPILVCHGRVCKERACTDSYNLDGDIRKLDSSL